MKKVGFRFSWENNLTEPKEEEVAYVEEVNPVIQEVMNTINFLEKAMVSSGFRKVKKADREYILREHRTLVKVQAEFERIKAVAHSKGIEL